MNTSQPIITLYLEYCKTQKCLDSKTLKAYKIDLNQFYNSIAICDINNISTEILENYIGELHRKYKPKTVKRKIASIKAFFHYLEYKDLIEKNPFNKLHVRFREPVILPKTIPLNIVEKLLSTIYNQKNSAKTNYQKRNSLRDVAVIEVPARQAGSISPPVCSSRRSISPNRQEPLKPRWTVLPRSTPERRKRKPSPC